MINYNEDSYTAQLPQRNCKGLLFQLVLDGFFALKFSLYDCGDVRSKNQFTNLN